MDRTLHLLAMATALVAIGSAIIAPLASPDQKNIFLLLFFLSAYAMLGFGIVISYRAKLFRPIMLVLYFAGLLLIIVMIVLDLWLF